MTIDVNMSTPPRRKVTRALRDLLIAQTGRPIGVVDVPDPEPGRIAPESPYGLVYPINDGGFWGGMGAPESSAEFTYQVTSVGDRDDQVEWLADKVREVLLGRTTAGDFNTAFSLADGWKVCYRYSRLGAGSMIRVDKLWTVDDTYCFHIVRA